MSCSYCHRNGHNLSTCPTVNRRCSICNRPDHYAPTCPEAIRCSICDGHGHNKRACPEAPGVVDLDIPDVPVPAGAKYSELTPTRGWFSRDLLDRSDPDEAEELKNHIDNLPLSLTFRPAFKRFVAAVHKASRWTVYVGRAGGTFEHVTSRFRAHRDNKDARWVFPILKVRTKQLKDEEWEKTAIRWVKFQDERDRLCCNNDAVDQRGQYPDTPECVLYVVACGRLR